MPGVTDNVMVVLVRVTKLKAEGVVHAFVLPTVSKRPRAKSKKFRIIIDNHKNRSRV